MLLRPIFIFSFLFCTLSEIGVAGSSQDVIPKANGQESSLHEGQRTPSSSNDSSLEDIDNTLEIIDEYPDTLQDWIQEGPSQESDEGGELLEEEIEEL